MSTLRTAYSILPPCGGVTMLSAIRLEGGKRPPEGEMNLVWKGRPKERPANPACLATRGRGLRRSFRTNISTT